MQNPQCPVVWQRRRPVPYADLSTAPKIKPPLYRIGLSCERNVEHYFPKITVLEKWELAAM
jgi:hypothetical protein